MLLLQVFSNTERRPLSVAERLEAVNNGFRDVAISSGSSWRLIGVVGAVLLLFAAGFKLLAWLRRARWISFHAHTLVAAGLDGGELVLFRMLAGRCDPTRVPLITRQRSVFDETVAVVVRHGGSATARRELLARLLALRRRIPFDARVAAPPEFERGHAVLLCVRSGRSGVRQVPAFVLATHAHALQLGIADRVAGDAIAPQLRTGAEVLLVVRDGSSIHEARVRVRGSCAGNSLQFLVDRPAALVPSQVRIAWRGADEAVQVEFVERYSDRLVEDAAPKASACVVAVCSEGLILHFETTRPRHGESIRLLGGAHAGFCRGYAVMESRGRGGDVFVTRRAGERSETPTRPREKGERHEPVARAR